MRRVLPLVLLLSCSDPLAWLYATDPEPYPAPAIYADWWARVEDCTGRTGDLQRVQFHVSDSLPCPDAQGGCRGLWVEPHDIYLLRSVALHMSVVRHEMTHDLLHGGGHPARYFPRCEGAYE